VAELHRSVSAKKKQFLNMAGGVCTMFKNLVNFTTFIKVYQNKSRVEVSFFHRTL